MFRTHSKSELRPFCLWFFSLRAVTVGSYDPVMSMLFFWPERNKNSCNPFPNRIRPPCKHTPPPYMPMYVYTPLGAVHKGYPTFQLVSRVAKMGYEDI